MVRATRSTAALQDKDVKDKDKTAVASPPTPRSKVSSKKRKRMSAVDNEEQPAMKQLRADDDEADLKEEPEEHIPEISNTGDLPLKEDDAHKILDVLEMIDTQGLLDRVFPLPEDSSSPHPSSSKTSPTTYSLRTLLKDSQDHRLRVLRSAVHHLIPISSQPRSRTSLPAAQQLRFCQLAISLLNQASLHTSAAFSLDHGVITGVITGSDKDADSPGNATHPLLAGKRRKYALMQKLPGGATWWTSINTDFMGQGPESKELRDLGTGHAELVSIVPSPSSSGKAPPTLGDFYTGRKTPAKTKPPGPRYVSCGNFLDYGPYASFAPSFENEGCGVGRFGLGSVMWRRHEKSKAREKARVLRERILARAQTPVATDVMEVDMVQAADSAELAAKGREMEKMKEFLQCLLTPEDIGSMESILDKLELEEDVSELLERNARALIRLEELQTERLGGEKGGSSTVNEDSEEWQLAQKIMTSLTLVASLRPRSSTTFESPLIPPQSVLRALHRMLPCDPLSGWHGTLAENCGTSVRDDNTVRVRTNAAVITQQLVPPAPTTAPSNTPAPVQAPSSTYPAAPFSQNYPYPNFSQHVRGPYQYPAAPGQAAGYYPSAYQQSTGAPTAQTTPANSFSPHPYPGTTQAAQYPYTGWYANYPAGTPANASTPNSGRGTPQPVAAAGSFSGFFATSAQAAPTRAVANTVVAKPQQNGWATAAGAYSAPTLPPHLRAVAPAPATPGTPSTPAGYASYYPSYQHTPTPSR